MDGLPQKKEDLFRIIGAIAGFFLLGRSIFGGIIGFLAGGFIDSAMSGNQANASQGSGRSQRNFNADDLFTYYQQRSSSTTDFATMLIALSAAVMRADGKVLKVELDFVKSFFKQQFGPQFTAAHLQTLKRFLDSDDIPLEQICRDIRMRTQEEVRVQLLHYLFGIAKVDGDVAASEMRILQQIANLLGIPAMDFESVKNMFYRDVNSDYKVLGLEPAATDDEIKKAYRQMAIRYHPDKVAQMGEEYQKGAKEKFQKIQEAYDNIKKSRGLK